MCARAHICIYIYRYRYIPNYNGGLGIRRLIQTWTPNARGIQLFSWVLVLLVLFAARVRRSSLDLKLKFGRAAAAAATPAVSVGV